MWKTNNICATRDRMLHAHHTLISSCFLFNSCWSFTTLSYCAFELRVVIQGIAVSYKWYQRLLRPGRLCFFSYLKDQLMLPSSNLVNVSVCVFECLETIYTLLYWIIWSNSIKLFITFFSFGFGFYIIFIKYKYISSNWRLICGLLYA